jgi:hypothetical protein
MDKPKRATFEELIEGRVSSLSLINEPIVDFAVEEPKAESALDRAQRRWRHAEVVGGDHDERR